MLVALAGLAACQPRPIHSSAPTSPAPQAPASEPQPTSQDPLAQLKGAGVRFRRAPVARTTTRKGVTCHVPDGVRVMRGATGERYGKAPHVNAGFAMRLAAFEHILQATAAEHFGLKVKRIEHFGTYVCRRVAGTAGTLSEHASGNAIDVSGFVLANGKRVTVKRDFVKAGQEPHEAEGRFLRDLVGRLRGDGTFGVILTPDWDKKHHNHFHLDGSRRFTLWRLFS